MCCEHRTLRTARELTDQRWLEAAARRAFVRAQPAPTIAWSLTWTPAPLAPLAPTVPAPLPQEAPQVAEVALA
jgi:hypothetical protein